jgi:hypothetical protein
MHHCAHIDLMLDHPRTQSWTRRMPRRKSLVQVSFRLRKDALRKLDREAKQHDRSVNDEIARRLEDSLAFDDWREKREQILLEMRGKLARHLKEIPPQRESVQSNPMDKTRGGQSVQVRFRLRQEIMNRLESEAKEHSRSVHDEIGIRLHFGYPDSWEQLGPLLSALIDDAKSHDNPTATIAAYMKLDAEAERDFQEQMMTELFRPRRIHSRAG